MERKIPLTFESEILSSPAEKISESNPNLRRVHVRAFSKYGNRNGSYITDQMAEKLVQSAINQPVVGWYDPQTESWAGHVGPTLANAYGYVESFVGWQPFTDTDGVVRDYSVFSVILFTDYYEAARKIVGSNQSMELNPDSIDGDWAQIGEQEYFVFTKAQIFSFCVIGTKEPCFSVSAFFTKNENATHFEKLKNLVFEMRKIVDECQQGGDIPMEEENKVIDTVAEEIVTPVEAAVEGAADFEEVTETVAEEVVETAEETVEETVEEIVEAFEAVEETEAAVETPVAEFEATEEETEEVVEETATADPEVEVEEPAAEEVVVEEPAQEEINFELLYTELKQNYETAQSRIEELEESVSNFANQVENLTNELTTANSRLADYELAEKAAIGVKKNELFSLYANNLSEDEIAEIRANVDTMTYDELESRLALTFSRKQIGQKVEAVRVPLMNTQESEFATFMKKYKKK